MNTKTLLTGLSVLLCSLIIGLAAWQWHPVALSDIYQSFLQISLRQWCLAALFTCASYGFSLLGDYWHLRHEPQLSRRDLVLAGFIGETFSQNTAGLARQWDSSRYRLYPDSPASKQAISQLKRQNSASFILGFISLWFATQTIALANQQLFFSGSFLLQLLFTAAAALALIALALLRFSAYTPTLLPADWCQSVKQLKLYSIATAVAHIVCAAAVLWQLMPSAYLPHTLHLSAYLAALTASIVGVTPAGVGVFEGSYWLLLGGYQGPSLIAALLAYRLMYHIIPLCFSGVFLFVYEWRTVYSSRSSVQRFLRFAHLPLAVVNYSFPKILSLLLLIAGLILLVSGNTSALDDRLEVLMDIIGLPFIELSHLVGSIVGVVLLFLARAVSLRIRSAYYITVYLLCLGIVASLLKGIDYEEALALLAVLALLIPSKHHFYRDSALNIHLLNRHWWILISVIVAFSVWVGFFCYKEVEYSHELWWQFELDSHASRFLRAQLLLIVLGLCGAIWFFTQKKPYQAPLPSEEEVLAAESLVQQSANSDHFLALTGDKFYFWSATQKAFIAYIPTAAYWYAMSDPCGDAAEFPALISAFREAADKVGAKIVFYRVTTAHLPIYIDMGLHLVKLGEEAKINLAEFHTQGAARASMRNLLNKMPRDGWQFEVIPAEKFGAIWPAIAEISKAWLHEKNAKEKSFSLGRCDYNYLSCCDTAIVRNAERIVAFMNILRPDNKSEMSIDLMRYHPDAPKSVMEYLTLSVIFWAKAEGYQAFNLGMAPLSGLDNDRLASLWHKVGAYVYTFGSEFYGFVGLRAYKEKFAPLWEPRYLAVPSSLHLPKILLSLVALISGAPKNSR
ncbi:MAG TPA: bifunctional lysylphosphatidylglycerol flippase/synthetase MprF, partial [Cellvibrionaceae bacterium]|nr:bifunctional lysylphosphatidylglycerol flippase/synthetase MprF [Cellvibrionaceae bacterium]